MIMSAPTMNTIYEIRNVVEQELNPRVDRVNKWARLAAIGALVGGFSTLALAIVEIVKLSR